MLEASGIGARVQVRHCLGEALALLKEEPFDCVLLDFHLSDGLAIDLLSRLRSQPTDVVPAVVVTSGYGDESLVVQSMHAGATDYIAKERLTPGAIGRVVRNSIEKMHLAQELDAHRSRLEAANEELTRQNREIQSFYHTVSHELKTPLTAIREFTSLVADGVLGPVCSEQQEALQTAVSCCDQLTRMVNDLFDAARLETGKLSLHCSQIDLSALIETELKVHRPKATDLGITLTQKIASKLPQIEGDKNRLAQVLFNLVDNALKFTRPGGRVLVSAKPLLNGEGVCLEVSDEGVGIAQDKADRIFDRLYQVDDHSSTLRSGMGVGLFLCKQIVELHGGSIRVQSTEGAGSCFFVELPRQSPHRSCSCATAAATASAQAAPNVQPSMP